jgi:hypothetical protein
MGKDRRQQIYVGFVADIDIKILGVPPPSDVPFLDNDKDTCEEGGYLFLPRFSSLYDAIHEWMTRRFTKNDHDILYYM